MLEPQVGDPPLAAFRLRDRGPSREGLSPVGIRGGTRAGRRPLSTGDGAASILTSRSEWEWCWTDLDVIELSRRFNFIVQGGLGVQGAGGAWTVEARFLHYSNANTVLPNLGLNSVVLLVGWRLR